MSYILDALKKAERDRAISKAPVLLAVHDLRPASPNHRWFIAGMLLLGCAAAAWFLLVRRPETNAPVPRVSAQLQKAAAPSEPGHAAPAAPIESASAVAALTAATPAKIETGMPPKSATGAQQLETAVMRPATESAPRPVPSVQSETPRQIAETAVPPAAVAPAATPSASVASAPAPAPVPADHKSLRDALAGMTITVLVYAEAKGERLVFINGRKYTEGDYVDDVYLLESIRPDGAVLSDGPERAVLRPGEKR